METGVGSLFIGTQTNLFAHEYDGVDERAGCRYAYDIVQTGASKPMWRGNVSKRKSAMV